MKTTNLEFNSNNILQQRQIAITAGISILIMALFAGLAYGFVLNNLFMPEDASATFNNIKSSGLLFRFGIICWITIFVLDIIVAWSFYIFLRQINRNLSLLAFAFRIMYTAFIGIALLNFTKVLRLTDESNLLNIFSVEEIESKVSLLIYGFIDIWSIGLIIFGFHLFILGYLTYKSRFIPKVFGVLLFIASFGYVFIHTADLLFPSYRVQIDSIENVMSFPMAIGELAFAFWLIIKGGK